jgi:hypothetical protein
VWAVLASLVAALLVVVGLFFFIRHRSQYHSLKRGYTDVDESD